MALALVLNSLTGILMGLLDQIMVGRLSIFAYGAVGVVSTSIYSITGIIGMIAVSFHILGAQHKEIEGEEAFFHKFKITQAINIAIGIIFIIIIQIFKYPILEIFFGLKEEILFEGVKYLNIYSISIGINLVLFTFSSLFKILDMTKFILFGNLIANISNLAIDYLLIYGNFGFPKMGVVGAAIGTVAGLLLNVAFYVYILVKVKKFNLRLQWKSRYITQLIKKSIPLMGQELLDGTIFSIVTIAIAARIGVTEVAVYTLIFNLINVLLMPMYAYSSATLNFVSKSIHEAKSEVLLRIPRICLGMSILCYITLGGVLFFAKIPILNLMVTDQDIVTTAVIFILLAIITYLLDVPHSIYKFSLQGINDEVWVFNISLIINVGCMLIMIYLTLGTKMQLAGIYIGIAFNYFILSLLFYIRYKKQIYSMARSK